MTVDEMIRELQIMSDHGYGASNVIVSFDGNDYKADDIDVAWKGRVYIEWSKEE